MAVVVMYRFKTSSAISKNVCSLGLYLYMWNESLIYVAKILCPHILIVLTGEFKFLTYAFLSTLFLPISYNLKQFPTPAKILSFHGYNTVGIP